MNSVVNLDRKSTFEVENGGGITRDENHWGVDKVSFIGLTALVVGVP